MKKVMIGAALVAVMHFSGVGNVLASGSVGQGNIGVYKGGQLADKLSGQNPVEEGALLVCDGKCMIKSEGISLVAADQAKLAIKNEDKAFNLFLREGYVNYTITNNTRQIAFHTAQGTYTTAEVIFNAGSNPVVRGYVQVDKDGQTEIGVDEGRLVFATAEGAKIVDANHKIILAVSDVTGATGATPAGAAPAGVEIGTGTLGGILGIGALVTGVIVVSNTDSDNSSPQTTIPNTTPPSTSTPNPAAKPKPTPTASPNV